MSFVTGRATYRTLVADPVLTAMIGALPGIPEALAADAQAEALLTEAAEPARTLDDDIDTLVAAGTVTPTEVARLAEHRANAVSLESERAVLLEIRARATTALEHGVTSAAPRLLDDLNDLLADLLDDAQTHVTTLGAISTAADAIDAGTDEVTAWSALTAHRRTYDALRRAQAAIMVSTNEQRWNTARRVGSGPALPASANDACVSNLDELWPTWRATKGTTQIGARLDPAGAVLRDSISGDRINGAPWPDEPVAEFVWLVAHAELWIPNPRKLDQLWDERQDRDRDKARELADEVKAGVKQTTKRLGHTESHAMAWHAMTGR